MAGHGRKRKTKCTQPTAKVTQEDRLRSYYLEYRSLWQNLEEGRFTGRRAVSDSNGQVELQVPDDPDATAVALISKDGARFNFKSVETASVAFAGISTISSR